MIKLKKDLTIYIKQKWEREMDTEIKKTGGQGFGKHSSPQLIPTCGGTCWKNIILFFITPKQKFKFSATSSLSWRKCGEVMAD